MEKYDGRNGTMMKIFETYSIEIITDELSQRCIVYLRDTDS
jgi:hypothetical protein